MAYTTMTPKYLDLHFWKQLYAGSLPLDHQERKEPVFLMPREEDGEKYIYILLTKHSDWVSLLVYLLAGRGYTHTSIALGDDPDSYYSFNFRGFVEETLEKHHRKGAQFCCYRVAVSQEAYEKIQHRLLFFRQHRKRFEYSRLGLLCCVLGLPLRRERKYFCSQFVAELLEKSQALALPRRSNLFQPNHFVSLLECNPSSVKIL